MNLHNEIMNIPVNKATIACSGWTDDEIKVYKIGHRDACHAAAELSLQAEQNKIDAERYRAWRDCVLSENPEFVESIQNGLQLSVPDSEEHRVTAAEWDAAIDFAIEECVK